MFHSARLRLTFLYILIVTLVSVSFSTIIYNDVASELQKGYESLEYRIQNQTSIFAPKKAAVLTLLADDLERAKKLVFLRLSIINIIIIASSGIAAYFLAEKTLRPVEIALEDQKRFVADASHELRTPLTSMKSEIEVALRNKSLSSKDYKILLNSSLEEIEKMQKLTNYLLALNRYESHSIKLATEKVNLEETINKILLPYKKLAKQKNIRLTVKSTSVFIKANKTSIEELLSILMDNAIKYTPSKGKIIVNIKGKRQAIIEIKDTGIGIKTGEIPYIFNRFFRADSSRAKADANGYGLGLSIAKSIVDLHKGEINAKSTLGKGTTFRVILPAAKN